MTRSVLGALDDTALHVMTLNVRRPLGRLAWRRADRWSRRRPLLAAMLADERPALVGCQEVVPSQARVIADALGPEYRRIGSGRTASPTSEGCAIFFDSGRLEVQEWHQSALSDSPDERGSRSWGNPFPRVLVTAVFRDRRTGARFAMLNTHLDPLSPRSRVRSALRIRETVAAAGLPAIVTGDANEAIGGPTSRALFHGGGLLDAWPAADVRVTPEWRTFADYRPPRPGPRIDWIAVTPEVHVWAVAIDGRAVSVDASPGDNSRIEGWPSDHLAVHAAVTIPGGSS